MLQNILIYLVTINAIMLALLYLLSQSLEKYRESLDEFASYLYSVYDEEDEDDDSRTRTTDVDE